MHNTNRKLHCCIVDDDSEYLESAKVLFDDQQTVLSYFNHPLEFLEFQKKYTPDTLYEIKAHTNDMIKKRTISNMVYGESYPIDIIISDYHMPQMSGVELLRESNALCKVLLTGLNSHKIAINAFNNGIINKFYLKSDISKSIVNDILEFYRNMLLDSMLSKSVEDFPYLIKGEYYILDNDLSIFQKEEKKIVYYQSNSDNKILNDILCESGITIPDGTIPVVFNENASIEQILFHKKITKEGCMMHCIIDDDMEIMKIMEILNHG